MSERTLRHAHVSLPLPTGWYDGSQVIILSDDTSDGFQRNLVYSSEPSEPGDTAAHFAARQLGQLATVLTDYRVVRQHDATYGPNTGYVREHRFVAEDQSIGQIQFYVINEGLAHTFTFSDLGRNIEASRAFAEYLFSRARLSRGIDQPSGPDDSGGSDLAR